MEIWTDFDLTLSVDDILRGEGMDPMVAHAKRPALVKAATDAAKLGLAKIHPAAAVCEVKVLEQRHERIKLEGETLLTGPLVARHLAGAERVAAVVCTIGPELERLATAQEGVLQALAVDGLGNAAVEALGQQICLRIGERAQAAGLETSAPLSPGEPDWPVEVGQQQIFSLLAPGPAGVRLTEGWMMIPMKSISFVIGIGPHMEQADLCELCSMKDRCRYRKG
jgi:hypothetical protein